MWIEYFVSGAVAIIVSWVLSGCVIGNYELDAPVPPQTPAPTLYYYLTSPTTLSLCASTNSTTGSNLGCASVADLTQIPSAISNIMTNPLGVLIEPGTGQGVIMSLQMVAANDTNDGLPIQANVAASNFSYANQVSGNPVWNDPGCVWLTSSDYSGSYNLPAPSIPQNLPVTVSGRLAASFEVDEQPTAVVGSSCAASLTALQTCYNDSTQCNSTLWTSQSVHAVLDSYVLTAKVLGSTQIATLFKLAFTVSYQ